MRRIDKVLPRILVLLTLFLMAGCQVNVPVSPEVQLTLIPSMMEPLLNPSATPFLPQQPTVVPATQTPTPIPVITVSFDPGVPAGLLSQIHLPEGFQISGKDETASLILIPGAPSGGDGTRWVFALVAPFPTLADEIPSEDLIRIWQGGQVPGWEGVKLYLVESTRATLERVWGAGDSNDLRIVENADNLIAEAWANQPALAIVPFEELVPRWKVLRVDGLSPLTRNLPVDQYFLTFNFQWASEEQHKELPPLPVSNRLEEKLTVITMTGVTALTRATGFMMDKYGLLYPGEDIRDWMREADFTHISNEVSFDPNCPAQDPNQVGLRFCSRPDYIQLLEDVGVDIVELTGNHLMDFRPESLPYTMQMYAERDWLTFGGGINLEEASQPALLEHNGNRFAFVGCNPAGPGGDWAGPGNAGTQPCDWDAFRQQIRDLTEQGYLVIATLQYAESYMATPVPQQVADFESLSAAGAVIVSGSQAHFPQGFEFLDGRLIHFGLGNLFFDQMDYPVVGTRREFLDRHVFYNGRHISTELLTAMLENYARPRPMLPEERRIFLQDLFTASGW